MTFAYFGLALWFYVFDMIAGDIAGSKRRPFSGAIFALAWPVSLPTIMLGAAIMIGSYREKERARTQQRMTP